MFAKDDSGADVRPPIVSPDKFAEWFNEAMPGAYRSITEQDARDMTEHGLIGKYQYYGRADLETVRAILLCEQLRDERSRKACLKDMLKTCKRCGKSLPETRGGKGRPCEYCFDCEPYRARERYLKWRNKKGSGRILY